MFKYDEQDRASNTPDEIAVSMLKMVQDGSYLGGTIMARTYQGEDVVFKGGPQDIRVDGQHVQSVLGKERGAGWSA